MGSDISSDRSTISSSDKSSGGPEDFTIVDYCEK